MTDYNYRTPTEAEIRAIEIRAQRMRAEVTRAGFTAAWGWLRALFTAPVARPVRAD
ncbi:hypothetical protein G5B40_06510 [Pikeienuella piscinae]|uniref:Uncharacterized protein n=1 Tax=Pikeienuella piscinae TaxID=2748098 RepID=A0A7L5BZ26_9RHOB|nr:hypothetical protein [Pikeienuella piscinae]QIE55134.1 hypothetical protein G5B40_06510 [Pikeienuella piscinae]